MPYISLIKKGKITQAAGHVRGLMGKVGALGWEGSDGGAGVRCGGAFRPEDLLDRQGQGVVEKGKYRWEEEHAHQIWFLIFALSLTSALLFY